MNSSHSPGAVKRAPMYQGVSCITFDAQAGERNHESACYFDVKAEDFSAGCITGAKAAYEVIAFSKTDDDACVLMTVLRYAVNEMFRTDIDSNISKIDKCGAAIGFLGAIEDLLLAAVRQVDLPALMADGLREYELSVEDDLVRMKKKNAAFLKAIAAGPVQPVASSIQ